MKNPIRINTLMSAITLLTLLASTAQSQERSECALGQWSEHIVAAWRERSMLSTEMTECYAEKITSMDVARELRDEVISSLDELLPRVAYKVVGLDPVNAALNGVDRPMVGAMYVGNFLPDGANISPDSASVLITEPDILFRVSSAAINEAQSLEEVLPSIDRVYAFIEVPAPLFNNNPANPFLMQASNLLPRWGVIGESIAVSNTPEFLRSLETMQVSFVDGQGQILAQERGDYLGGNPLNGVLVVLEELRRKGEQLRPGDLISSGSYMPPILVAPGMFTKAVYTGIGGQDLEVSASYD